MLPDNLRLDESIKSASRISAKRFPIHIDCLVIKHNLLFIVTNKFPDGNFSRPQLTVFVFVSQNKNIAAPWLN